MSWRVMVRMAEEMMRGFWGRILAQVWSWASRGFNFRGCGWKSDARLEATVMAVWSSGNEEIGTDVRNEWNL